MGPLCAVGDAAAAVAAAVHPGAYCMCVRVCVLLQPRG